MRAVWSYWTKPNRVHAHWGNERSHLLSWVLSVETARKHYPECALVTDSEGARLLVDELGLPFTDVSTELDALAEVAIDWWAIGKLHAYRAQRVPFVHIDSDVYLWNRLPAILEHAPVLAQSPEFTDDMEWVYQPVRIRNLIQACGGWVPEEWSSYIASGPRVAANCGIVGGTDVELLRHYATVAIDVALEPRNHAAWAQVENDRNPLVEQYLLCACVEHANTKRGASERRARVQYLFPSGNMERAAEAGYTHLIFTAKSNAQTLARLERRVRRDYPAYHRRCVELTGGDVSALDETVASAREPGPLPALAATPDPLPIG